MRLYKLIELTKIPGDHKESPLQFYLLKRPVHNASASHLIPQLPQDSDFRKPENKSAVKPSCFVKMGLHFRPIFAIAT
jgi:hypothetical protein